MSIVYDTIVEKSTSLILDDSAKAYNTIVNPSGRMFVGIQGYVQANIINGGTVTNSHIGSGS